LEYEGDMKTTDAEFLEHLRGMGYSSLAEYQKHILDELDKEYPPERLAALAEVLGTNDTSGIPDANGRRVWKFRPSGLIDSEPVDDDGDHE